MALTQDTLVQYVVEKLNLDSTKVAPETALLTSGLIDSFSLVELVLFIEKSCGFKLRPSDINLDNLDSIERILTFVKARSK
jgi:acyl carrier protein